MGIPALAIAAGSAIAGYLASRKKVRTPSAPNIDLTKELAMIDELYAAEKASTQSSLGEALKTQNRLTAESLAGRGVYSSPVSQYSFGQNQKSYAQALADALSNLGAKQAEQKATLSASGRQFNAKNEFEREMALYKQRLQNREALAKMFYSISGSALGSRLSKSSPSGGVDTSMDNSSNDDLIKNWTEKNYPLG